MTSSVLKSRGHSWYCIILNSRIYHNISMYHNLVALIYVGVSIFIIMPLVRLMSQQCKKLQDIGKLLKHF